MATAQLPRIAIASGDPAGIGPEISLKAALDTQVRRMYRPLVVGDPMVLEAHARAARIAMQLHVVTRTEGRRLDERSGQRFGCPDAGPSGSEIRNQ